MRIQLHHLHQDKALGYRKSSLTSGNLRLSILAVLVYHSSPVQLVLSLLYPLATQQVLMRIDHQHHKGDHQQQVGITITITQGLEYPHNNNSSSKLYSHQSMLSQEKRLQQTTTI